MHLRRWRLAAAASISIAAACDPGPDLGAEPSPGPEASGKTDVWVSETRLEWFELDSLGPQRLEPIRNTLAAVAAVTTQDVVDDWPERGTAAEVLGVCDDEAFAEQPATRSHSSAVRVGPDLVLTAWHSVRAVPCSELRFVFGDRLEAPLSDAEIGLPDPDRDIYGCREVVLPASVEQGERLYDEGIDLALVRLDRVVDSAYPVAPVTVSADFERPAAVFTAGHPLGMPLKIDASATLLGDVQGTNLFELGSDLFGGNSGGPVLNESGEVFGVVKGGPRDFEFDRDAECRRYAVHGVQTNKGSWAAVILDEYCASIDGSAPWCER